MSAELLELREARLEILPLRCELVEVQLLRLVLLLRQRVHLAERLAAALETLRALCELFAVVSLGALVGAGVLEPSPCLVRLGLDAGDLDVDSRDTRGGARQRLAQLDLGGAEPAQLLAERPRPRTARVDACPERRLEAGRRVRRRVECRLETLRSGEHTRQLVRSCAPATRAHRGVDPRGLGRPGAVAELGGLRGGGIVRRDEGLCLLAVPVRLGSVEGAAEP